MPGGRSNEKPVFYIEDEPEFLGFVQTPTPVMYDNRITDKQRTLYGVLRRYAFQKGHCFPGIPRLAKAIHVTERNVYPNLSALEEVGLIRKEKRPGFSNVYWLPSMGKVYGEENMGERLRSEFIQLLIDVGEESTVKKLLKSREAKGENTNSSSGFGSGGNSGSVAPNKASDDSPADTSQIKSPVRSFDQMQDRLAGRLENDPEAALHAASVAAARSSYSLQKSKERKLGKIKRRKDVQIPVEDQPERSLNSRDVQRVFYEGCEKRWPHKTWLLDDWDRSLWGVTANLCRRWTPDLVVMSVKIVLENWEAYANEFGIKKEPNMKMFAYFSDSWFPRIRAGEGLLEEDESVSRTNRPGQLSRWFQGEYDEQRDGKAGQPGGGLSFFGGPPKPEEKAPT